MDQERNLGVTEARFALTILTCLLVAIGYIALLRLGGTKATTADVSPDEISIPSMAGLEAPPIKVELPPRVLPLEEPEDTRPEAPSQLAERPNAPQQSPESERR